MNRYTPVRFPDLGRGLILISCTLLLGGCNSLSQKNDAFESIGYRDARFQALSSAQEYRECRNEALELDEQARQTESTAKYLASARLLEKCESNLGPVAVEIPRDERMHAYALVILNLLRAGEPAHAKEALAQFESAFPNHDLYFTDGSSYKDSMRTLLDRTAPKVLSRYSLLNASIPLKSEMRRVDHWKQY